MVGKDEWVFSRQMLLILIVSVFFTRVEKATFDKAFH
jgi:hypothetical protein